ncbi:MAG TPA: hypothetical protein VGN57_00415 [Pirellulaceae bacterium]|jgi:hypothetical protein|nr:hypothetical protein [Pirellulaceae bacterium]
MEGPIFLLLLTLLAVGLWIWVELTGSEWQRFVAGIGMAICFALCGAGIMAVIGLSDRFGERFRLNQTVGDMLDRTIERVEAGEREELASDLRAMREQVQPTYEYWAFEEPFEEFARRDASSSPEVEVRP